MAKLLPEEKFNSQEFWAQDWGQITVDGQEYSLSGAQVQTMIKDYSITALHSFEETQEMKIYVLGFSNEEKKNEWMAKYSTNPTTGLKDGPICYTSFAKEEPQPYDIVGLSIIGSNRIISLDNRVILRVNYKSVLFTPSDKSETENNEDGEYIVESRINSNYSWSTIQTGKLSSNTNSDIDISNSLNSGTYDVRVRVTGETTQKTTSWVSFKVTKTEVKLEFSTDWATPQSGAALNLGFSIYGTVDKNLHVEIYGNESQTGKREIEKNIGTQTHIADAGSPGYLLAVSDDATDPYKVASHGIHKIKAWLEVVETGQVTQPINIEIMRNTDPANKNAYLLLSNISETLTNWSYQHILDYAVYDPNTDVKDVTISLKDYNSDNNYLKIGPERLKTNTIYSLVNSIEVETNSSFSAEMTFMSGDQSLRSPLNFVIEHNPAFGPTSGASFIFDPKSRSNNEDENSRQLIYNSAAGASNSPLDCSWSGFNFNRDGWINTNEGKCLRVLAGQQLDIMYNPYLDDKNSPDGGWTNNSCTMEMTMSIRNIVNPDAPILKICTEDPINGIILYPNQLIVADPGNKVYKNQDIVLREGVKTHVAVNYISKFSQTTDGEGNPVNLNLVRIFVNGRINREYEFNDSSYSFIVDNQNTVNKRFIQFGNSKGGADLDIYGMRIYKSSLNSDSIFNDYIATISTPRDKEIEIEANDIFEAGSNGNFISYDKASTKYNTILWQPLSDEEVINKHGNTTHIASKINQGEYPGDLVIRVLKDKIIFDDQGNELVVKEIDNKRSGVINNVRVKGQGTSSMTYWKWNQRWEFDKLATGEKDEDEEDICFKSKFTDLNGDEFSGWQVEEGCPIFQKI